MKKAKLEAATGWKPPHGFNEEKRHRKEFVQPFFGDKSLDRAKRYSRENGWAPVFAADIKDSPKDSKSFFVCSYKSYHAYFRSVDEEERNFYEVLIDLPCHLYADVEFDYERNPNSKQEVLLKLFNSKVYKTLFALGFVDDPDGAAIDTVLFDSSTQKKCSMHIIYRLKSGAMFLNNLHCGSVMRFVRNLAMEEEGLDIRQNPLFVWAPRKKKEELWDPDKALVFFGDMGVYTRDRLYRCPFNTKTGRGSYLVPFEKAGLPFSWAWATEVCIMGSFVQRDARPGVAVLHCKNPDGTDAKSTSDKHYCQPNSVADIDLAQFYVTFPFETLWNTFGLGHPCREFCFSYAKKWQRPLFFDSCDALRSYAVAKAPEAIHIGAVYNNKSKQRVVRRELVFDIDLNDYKDEQKHPLRRCCGDEKKCCVACWNLALLERDIMRYLLCRVLGFKDVHFFYSGGRGIHCWVFDEAQALYIVPSVRREIAAFLSPKTIDMKSKFVDDVWTKIISKQYRAVFAAIGVPCDTASMPPERATRLLWPRLDEGVTVDITHAIKIPFCRHPRTKEIARSIDNE